MCQPEIMEACKLRLGSESWQASCIGTGLPSSSSRVHHMWLAYRLWVHTSIRCRVETEEEGHQSDIYIESRCPGPCRA